MPLRALLRIHDSQYYKELDVAQALVGRAIECDVPVVIQGISRKHAKLFQFNGRWAISDLGSTHGTKVNGVAVDTRGTYLGEQDVAELGPSHLGIQLRLQYDTTRPLPPECKPLTIEVYDKLGSGSEGKVLTAADEPEDRTQSAPVLPEAPPALQDAAADLIAAPSSVRNLTKSSRRLDDDADIMPAPHFVPGGIAVGMPIPGGEPALHPISLSAGEHVQASLALVHHSIWITDRRAIWKGSGEYQSLFWRDVLAAVAEGPMLSFRLRESAISVDLPVGEQNAIQLLLATQAAREKFDMHRAANEKP